MGSIAVGSPVEVPSSDRCESGSFPLITAKFPRGTTLKTVDADDTASKWVEAFNKCITNPELATIPDLFLDEGYWRDQLCLSWDFHTLQGPKKIVELLKANSSRVKSLSLDKSSQVRSPATSSIDDGKVPIVQAFLKVQTDVGSGEGHVRLVQENGTWKVFTLFTFLKDLRGFEEAIGMKRPNGVQHGEHRSQQNWLDRRAAEEKFEGGEEPTVLILGNKLQVFLKPPIDSNKVLARLDSQLRQDSRC